MSRVACATPGVKARFGQHGMMEYMTTVLGVYVAAQLLELLIWTPLLWRVRRYTAVVGLFAAFVSLIILVAYDGFSFLVAMLACVSIYRGLNLWRLIIGRMQVDYLWRATWRTSLWLLASTFVFLLLWWTLHELGLIASKFWVFFLILELITSVLLLITTLKHAESMKPNVISEGFAAKDLPTLTVAIPARNETDDLQIGLETLIKSTYPKLEILVLDDCSTVKRTPEIIRGFAQDGVRFLKGEPPKEGWLSKNQAYQSLLEAANGELVLFCGADVRFEPQTLTNIVTLMLRKNKSMMSIMPRNILPRFMQLDASLIQPMRYAWEVALPRKLFRRPPVLSTCWIAKRQVLLSAGGFSAVSRTIVPESYFARQTVRHDGYGFRYSSSEIGLTSDKDVMDQRDTATRTKYPQLHRRMELVFLLTLAELGALVMPFLFLIVGILNPYLSTVLALSAGTCAILLLWYLTVCAMTYRQPDIRSLLSLPFAALLDVALLNYSMLKYEFSVVLWKDRNVCIPVMRIEPKLPKLN